MSTTFALAPAHLPRNKSPWASRALALPGAWRLPGRGALAMGADKPVTAPEEDSDAWLVARVASGDERAFAMVVRRHAGRVKALALGFSGQAGEADDIVQETFWSFWRHAGRWQAGGPPLGAYLARIAMNRAIDAARRRKVRAFFGLEDAAEVADASARVDDRLAVGSELAAVSRDLLDLPERQREAILLAADGANSNADIAAAMGLTVGAVEQLLVRARRTLRLRLAARDDGRKET
jgi:RNA polymerase sigma-70 factor (ECF subfamily)